MQTEPPNAAPPKRKRRWFQFSLRTLMIGVVIVAIACGWIGRKIERKHQERDAVEELRKKGATVFYDFNRVSKGSPPGPDWVRKLLGENYFSEVEWVIEPGNLADDDLKIVSRLTQLKSLRLYSAKITDAGLVNLSHLTELQELYLVQAAITNSGLENLKGLTQLRSLWLYGTNVSDAGLVNLRGLSQLKYLSLVFTKVSDNGIEELQKALPSCKIEH